MMPDRSYGRVLARIFNVPLLVAPEKAEVVVAAIAGRLGVSPVASNPNHGSDLPDPLLQLPGEDRSRREWPLHVTEGGVGVILVDGLLVHEAAAAALPSGATTYGEIRDAFAVAAEDDGIRGIVVDLNTTGGEASDSLFELAEFIRQVGAEKPVWAVADEMALSAGYLLAAAAGRVLVPSLGFLGSIGTIAMHLDRSKADRQQGLTWTFVHAGARKADFSQHRPLAPEAHAWLEDLVEDLNDRFVQAVVRYRGLGEAAVRGQEAAIYRGEDAVGMGLADGIADLRTTLETLEAQAAEGGAAVLGFAVDTPTTMEAEMALNGTKGGSKQSGETKPKAEAPKPDKAADAAAEDEHKEDQAPDPTAGEGAADPGQGAAAAPAPAAARGGGQVVDLDAARAQGAERAKEIADLCTIAGRPDLISGYLTGEKTVGQVRSELVELRAAASDAAGVVGTQSPGNAPGSAPDPGGSGGWASAFAKVSGRKPGA